MALGAGWDSCAAAAGSDGRLGVSLLFVLFQVTDESG